MPSPRLIRRAQRTVIIRALSVLLTIVAWLSITSPASAQIASATNLDGRKIFVNAEPPVVVNLTPFTPKAPKSIYLSGEIAFMGKDRPGMNLEGEGAEKLLEVAAARLHVAPAMVRAVIETESKWNPAAKSRK